MICLQVGSFFYRFYILESVGIRIRYTLTTAPYVSRGSHRAMSCLCSPNGRVLDRKTGWWLTNPSKKYEFVSWDDSSQYRKIKMFQTTNQIMLVSVPFAMPPALPKAMASMKMMKEACVTQMIPAILSRLIKCLGCWWLFSVVEMATSPARSRTLPCPHEKGHQHQRQPHHPRLQLCLNHHGSIMAGHQYSPISTSMIWDPGLQ